jgi:hypothetical protein
MDEYFFAQLDKGYEVTIQKKNNVDDSSVIVNKTFKKYTKELYTIETNHERKLYLITKDMVQKYFSEAINVYSAVITNMGEEVPSY